MILSKHAMFTDEFSNLWSIGDNSYGQLGTSNVKDIALTKPVMVLSNVLQASTGYKHSSIITRENRVMCVGDNTRSQLGSGINESASFTYVPDYVEFPEENVKIVQVECGLYYTVALDSEGNIWSWGDNTYLQLGEHQLYTVTSTGKRISTPVKLDPTKFNKYDTNLLPYDVNDKSNRGIVINGDVYELTVGLDFTVLRINNLAWAWGNNSSFPMTAYGPSTCSSEPILLNDFLVTASYTADFSLARNKFTTVVAGDRFIVYLTEEGQVYITGTYITKTIDGWEEVVTQRFTAIADEIVYLHYSTNSILMTRNNKTGLYDESLEIKMKYADDLLYLVNSKVDRTLDFDINLDFHIYDYSTGITQDIYVKGWRYLGTTNNTFISDVNVLLDTRN